VFQNLPENQGEKVIDWEKNLRFGRALHGKSKKSAKIMFFSWILRP
jgi:hypothetical protein